MVGFPMLAGFISKLLFATSALQSPHKMFITLIALAVSTVLNAVYFLRLVITLYRPTPTEEEHETVKKAVVRKSSWNLRLAIWCFIVLNVILGMFSQPIVNAISNGLMMFE